jgi:hypothetical protein
MDPATEVGGGFHNAFLFDERHLFSPPSSERDASAPPTSSGGLWAG